MMRMVTMFLISLLLCSVAMAEPTPRPDDFARMMPLALTGTGPLHELALPAEVYRWTRQDNLTDVAVVNGAGELVPFAIIRPAVPKNDVTLHTLPLFPLNSAMQRADGSLALELRTDRNGATVNLATGPGQKTHAPTSAYVVDASGLDQTVSGFDLALTATSAGYLGSLQVEVSDDLKQWRYHAGTAMATLASGSGQLTRQCMEFPPVKSRYYRFTLGPTEGAPRLDQADARIERSGAEQGRARADYLIKPVKGRQGEYLAQSSGRMPVDRLRLVFPDDNSTATVTFLSRPDDTSQWTCRGAATFYRMRRDTVLMESPPLTITPTTDTHWLIRVQQPGVGLGERLPRLEVSWLPHRVVFAARGDAPFRILYGSGRKELGTLQDSSIAASLETWGKQQIRPLPARAGASVETGGRQALRSQITAMTWRKTLLWGTLILGVLILAFMAWRLAGEISRNAAHEGHPHKKDPAEKELNR